MKIKQKIRIATLCFMIMGSLLTTLVSTPSVHADCGGAKTTIITCSNSSANGGGIWGLLGIGIQILTAGVFIVATGGIIYGAILWTTAGDKSGQISQAKTVITNVVIGLVAYALMWSGLQFLIPGGVFSGGSTSSSGSGSSTSGSGSGGSSTTTTTGGS